jgi:hypothetical protein
MVLTCLFASAVAAAGPAPEPAPPDLPTLLRDAQRIQQADAAAWRRFRFSREARVERLGPEGQVTVREETLSEVTPLVDSFDERLLRIDGRDPTDEEIARHRQKEPFARHYRALRAGGGDMEEEGGYSLASLLRLSSYRYAGREMVGGAESHRLDFQPDPEPKEQSLEARVAGAMAGSLWLTVDGLHLIRARAASVRPVPLTLGLVSVRSLALELESAEVAPGTWLPRRVVVKSDVRIVFLSQARRRVITYSRHAPMRVIEPR